MKNVVLIAIGLLVLGSCRDSHVKRITGLEGKPLPSFDLLLADGITHFNTNSIPTGRPAVLFSFEPWCPFSRAQTEEMVSQMKSLKDVDVYMFCNSTFQEFKVFYDHYQLYKFTNVHAGVVSDYTFYKYFSTSKIPLFAIYDTEKKLKEVALGVTKISNLQKMAMQ